MLADFHNHSCLSPCGSLELSPRVLVETASARKVQIPALPHHNTSRNCPAFAVHCKRLGIIPLYGLEVTVLEEAHMVTLFGNLEAAVDFGEYIYSIITPLPNNPEKTGDQVYVDADDNIVGQLEYFLPVAANIGVDDLGPEAAKYGGIVIPAHIDRSAFSMASQFGAVVYGPWAALECIRIPPILATGYAAPPENGAKILDTLDFPLITGSDAHYIEHIGRRSFELDAVIEELLPGGPDGDVDMETLKRALGKRVRM
jgi:hypothetical protein